MPKCKNCKAKFNPKYFNQKYCLKDECISVFAKESIEKQKKQKQKEWINRKKELKEKQKTHKDYLKELQLIFNKYIRLRDKKKPCISCNKKFKPNEKYDAGHYYSVGAYPNIRFNEFNVHAQCVRCNQHLHGNIHNYTNGIKERIGNDDFEYLNSIKNISNKLTISEIKEKKEYYKQKIKELQY